jgi:hypothetical protein
MIYNFALRLITTGCQTKTETDESNVSAKFDTTPRVTGIGGIFFAANQPDSLKQWYADKPGMKTDEFGSVFEFINSNKPIEINYLRWSVFSKSDIF